MKTTPRASEPSDGAGRQDLREVRYETCQWNEDADGVSTTACGHTFALDDSSGAAENGLRFCHFCGKRIRLVPAEQESNPARLTPTDKGTETGSATTRLLTRLGLAVLLVCGLASIAVVILHAEDGPYNSNPPFCRTHTPLNPYWWYYACQYPDPPDWGYVDGANVRFLVWWEAA